VNLETPCIPKMALAQSIVPVGEAAMLPLNKGNREGDVTMPDITWIEACKADDLNKDDVIRFDHDDRTFAIYRSSEGELFATDGYCTHAQAHLADGFMEDEIIECPVHGGRFNYKTGEALGAPVCINLKTYPVKLESGKVFINLG
jgi:3-phenylpropionate/trans-cinnamate dioxygenase ferredoxin subunit